VYLVGGLTVPDEVTVIGEGYHSILKKIANGPVMTLGNRSSLSKIYIDGNAVSGYTGSGIAIPPTPGEYAGYQHIAECVVYYTESYCIHYTAEFAGYGSIVTECELVPNAPTTTYAVKWGVESDGGKHGYRRLINCLFSDLALDCSGSQVGIFSNNITGGTTANVILTTSTTAKVMITNNRFTEPFTLNGYDCVVIGNVSTSPIILSSTSHDNTITGNRINGGGAAGQAFNGTTPSHNIVAHNVFGAASMTLAGVGVKFIGNSCSNTFSSITGSDHIIKDNTLSGALTLTAGLTTSRVSGNVAASYTDNSTSVGSNSNEFDIPLTTYTPTWTASGTAPAIVDGTLAGDYSRIGRRITAHVLWQPAAGTTFGTGTYFWALPFVPSTTAVQNGMARIFRSGVNNFTGTVETLTDGTARCQVYVTGSGSLMAQTVPYTWVNNDYMYFTITYEM
jgi:hypothetical protein